MFLMNDAMSSTICKLIHVSMGHVVSWFFLGFFKDVQFFGCNYYHLSVDFTIAVERFYKNKILDNM